MLGLTLTVGILLMGCSEPRHLEQAGEQVSLPLSETQAPFGYHQHLPSAYRTDRSRRFPLLIFLHGSGERGDGDVLLERVLRHGPPRVIEDDEWSPGRPVIVLSPQLDTTQDAWPVEKVDGLIDHAVETYRVDTTQIYLTGLSLGGHGTWNYAAAHPDRLAAAAPVCGDGRQLLERGRSYCDLSSLPLWAFHGADDPVVDPQGSIVPVQRIVDCSPSPAAKLTLFPEVGHDSWSLVYDGSGQHAPQEKAPFNQSLYNWLLSHDR